MNYEEALKDAPSWIQDAWKAFNELPKEEQFNTPFLYFVLGKGKGTPPFKMCKKESVYKEKSTNPNFICGNCIFYYINPVKKVGVCSQIRGNVKKEAICRLWVGKNALSKK